MSSQKTIASGLKWGVAIFLVVGSSAALWRAKIARYPSSVLPSQAKVFSSVTDTRSKSNHVSKEVSELPATNGELLALLHTSAVELSPLKLQAFLDYLKNPQRAETAMNPAAEYFNNIISLLLKQSEFSADLSKTLLGVVNDAGQSLLLRDYAMQHFFHCWNRESNMETRRALESSLKSHAQDGKSQLQGVALLTTSRFYEQGKQMKGPSGETLTPIGGSPALDPLSISKPSSFAASEFVTSALQVTTDLAAAPGARACAFNVLLNMEVRQVIVPARRVLHEPTTPDEVRCSSLAVIGAFGNLAQDRVILDSIPLLPDHVRRAADLALSKLFQSTKTKP